MRQLVLAPLTVLMRLLFVTNYIYSSDSSLYCYTCAKPLRPARNTSPLYNRYYKAYKAREAEPRFYCYKCASKIAKDMRSLPTEELQAACVIGFGTGKSKAAARLLKALLERKSKKEIANENTRNV